MRRDPAVRAAAVALTHGLDPLSVLALGPDDFEIVTAAINEANVLRNQREDALAQLTARYLNRALVKALSSR